MERKLCDNVKGSILLPLFVLACLSSCQTLRRGDLLFHVTDADTPITSVTPAGIDHVAIYAGRQTVIEAIPRQGVVTTPLHTVLTREDGSYMAAKVKGAARRASLAKARSHLGMPYDSLFLANNGAVYCSELVQLSFVDRHGRLLFATIPMTFRRADGTMPEHWSQLYARHGMPVPEGEPGTNPGEMSQRAGIIIKKLKY